jgi:hypothetical protein
MDPPSADGRLRYAFHDYDPSLFLRDLPMVPGAPAISDDDYAIQTLKLMELTDEYTRRSGYRLANELKFPPMDEGWDLQPAIRWALQRQGRVCEKLEFFTRSYFRDATNFTLQLLQLMHERRESGAPVELLKEDLNSYFVNTHQNQRVRQKRLFRVVSLKFHVDKFLRSPRFPEIPVQHLRQAMLESSKKVIDVIEFGPHGFFDDFLSFFVRSHPTFNLKFFDEAVEGIAQKSESVIDFSPVKHLVAALVQLLAPKHPREVIVIKNGVYRIFFDRFYLVDSRFIGARSTEPDFLTICERMQRFTPAVMAVSENMLLPEMMNVPFTTLVDQHALLQAAVAELKVLPFTTNPVDMMAHVYNTLKGLEDFARENDLARAQVAPSAENSKGAPVRSDGLAFDDFFPLFCLVLAAAAPSNAQGIADGFSRVTGLLISSSLDFSKLFFVSVIEYLAKVNLADFEQGQPDLSSRE